MFYEEIRIKQSLSNIPFCSLRILYNSKFIIKATSLGTNDVVVTRVHTTMEGIVEKRGMGTMSRNVSILGKFIFS